MLLLVFGGGAAELVVLEITGWDDEMLACEVDENGALSEPGHGLSLGPCLCTVPSLRWSCRTA